MKGILAFTIVLIFAALILLVIYVPEHAVFDGICSYKREFGLFPYFRLGSDALPTSECGTGVLLPGALYTFIATAIVFTGLIYSWHKFVKVSPKHDFSSNT